MDYSKQNEKKINNNISPEEKLKQALNLYWTAYELKKAALRSFYPSLTEEEIDEKVKQIFSNVKNRSF
ncbi:MAG: hypothetical protein RDU14_07085 [Melioribacteraceae bacterium]|nr:hypothetical protein [Melioribacteraceae bacterium]